MLFCPQVVMASSVHIQNYDSTHRRVKAINDLISLISLAQWASLENNGLPSLLHACSARCSGKYGGKAS